MLTRVEMQAEGGNLVQGQGLIRGGKSRGGKWLP